ncbi:PfkB family carbohydrate kinase [Bacillus dakarensis]|uniref:PfkB family carbohydrate kinase n=1 Tax=Robertmurraya dakarensis TaxID=1926278 RepID=UPI0009818E28|nr:PfkB family carbohydrate kinase [Bacillus dakarensis]
MPEKLSGKETTLINLIRENPFISQQELAEILGLSRPSIANMISGLTKKGLIVGRAYILNDSEQIVCIGGANVDRKFFLKEKTMLGTSNPVKSSQSVGGVARNIAENLGRLGMDVTLLTKCGADSEWKFIEDSSSLYMNLEKVIPSPDHSTGSYSAVLDENGDMVIALADMEVYEYITPELILSHESLLKHAKCIIADLNCPKEALQTLCYFAKKHDRPLIFIPVSSPKMARLPDDLTGVTWLITNRDESETFFQQEIKTESEWREFVEKWLSLGISNVVITKGADGVMIGNKEEGVFHIPAIKSDQIIDVTGAGDAFSSGVIFSWLEGNALKEIGKAGIVNAYKTLHSPFTVREDLTATQLQKDMEELS